MSAKYQPAKEISGNGNGDSINIFSNVMAAASLLA
jgi:hypothetical protein